MTSTYKLSLKELECFPRVWQPSSVLEKKLWEPKLVVQLHLVSTKLEG